MYSTCNCVAVQQPAQVLSHSDQCNVRVRRRANRLAQCLLACCECLGRLEETFRPDPPNGPSLFSYSPAGGRVARVTYRSALFGLLTDLTRAYAIAISIRSLPNTTV